MMADYLKQTAVYERYLGTSTDAGDKQYASATTIRCRIRNTATNNFAGHYDTVNRGKVIHTETLVAIGDRIDDCEVTEVREWVNYAGVVIGVVATT